MSAANKVLVVGASIAGPVLCYWLKQYGFQPTLIEKSSSLRAGGHAIDIRGIAVDIIKKMGIYDAIVKQRTSLKSGKYVDANGQTLSEEEGEKFGFREGEDVEIVRGDLVEILIQQIPEVPCYFSHHVVDLENKEDTVVVKFNDEHIEEYDLVIGADGLHSTIRKLAFSATEYEKHNLGSYISVFGLPNFLDLNQCEILFESQQKLVHISSDKDQNKAQAGFMFRSEVPKTDLSREEIQKNFLKQTFTDLGWQTNEILAYLDTGLDFYFDSITQVKMQQWTKGRVALVGDSGYCASPLSGQGTSLAIVGAYVLAGELKQHLNDYHQSFAKYNELMRPYVDANQALGAFVSENFLCEKELSPQASAQRTSAIMVKLQHAAKAILLPEY